MMRKAGLLPAIEHVSVSAPIADGARTLCELQPRLVTGFAIGIEALAEHILQQHLKLRPPKVEAWVP
jgi:hypothetical protein